MSESFFGRYKILGLLGEGGMAQVYLAQDPSLARCVALKVIRTGLSMRPDWIRRFHQEATTVARLGNSHVIQVHDLGNQDGSEYLVMEFLDRGSLEKVVAKQGGKLDAACTACIGVQAAEGLRAAHEAGVIHRDVKPDNLLLSREGIVKVADFGISRLQDEISRTQTGTALGSPQFMSPEQVEGKTLSGKSDVFALAGVLHLCLSGKHPFEAEQAHALMWKIVSQDAPVLLEAAPECPEDLCALIQSMHHRNPDKRPAMDEVVRRLRAWLAEQGILDPAEYLRTTLGFPQAARMDAPTPTGSTQVVKLKTRKVRSRKKLGWMVAAGALAGIVALTAGFFAMRAKSAPVGLSQGGSSSETGDRIEGLVARVRDEDPAEKTALRLRIAVVNETADTFRNLSLEYPFQSKERPVAESWYAPGCDVGVEKRGSESWVLRAVCHDVKLAPNQTWPGPDGLSLGVHRADWKDFDAKMASSVGGEMQASELVVVRAD